MALFSDTDRAAIDRELGATALMARGAYELTALQDWAGSPPVARISTAFGIVLILVGVAAYGMTAFATWTALIPPILGLASMACAVLNLSSEISGTNLGLVVALGWYRRNVHARHGFGHPLRRTAADPASIIISMITFVLLITYGIIAARSLVVAARAHRHLEGAVQFLRNPNRNV